METNYILFDGPGENESGSQQYLFAEEVYRIIGACMEVHSTLGKGFLEIVYKDALEYEFNKRHIPYEREKRLNVHYKDIILPHYYFADFYVFNEIILEVKAQEGVVEDLYKQTINYLAACQKQIGVLVNFGGSSLTFKRLILSKQYSL